jgi:hypothetical protein
MRVRPVLDLIEGDGTRRARRPELPGPDAPRRKSALSTPPLTE